MTIARDGLRGVRLQDVYRDSQGDLWEVVTLCDEPQARFQRLRDGEQVQHVIGCPNMEWQFPSPPLRADADVGPVRTLMELIAPFRADSYSDEFMVAYRAVQQWLRDRRGAA